MKHKTSELEGVLLDAAVAKALGHAPFFGGQQQGQVIPSSFQEEQWRVHNGWPVWRYSAEWVYGGPLIEREQIDLSCCSESGDEFFWTAQIGIDACEFGLTPLVAAMRAFVASKLGEEVEL